MDENAISQLETELAEVLGAMKELFREFEARLGEVVAAQRLANSEARNEGAKVRAALEELARSAKSIGDGQRQALTELRDGWRIHVADNSRAAGAELAQKFGEGIAAGLERRLATMTCSVDQATRRLGWISALKWVGGIAAGIALSIPIGVWALIPSVDGMSMAQVRIAMTRLKPCRVGDASHVCIVLDSKPKLTKEPDDETLAVIRGM
jgi:hypothetical protein